MKLNIKKNSRYKTEPIYVRYCDRCGMLFRSKIKIKFCLSCMKFKGLIDFKKYKECFLGYINA